MNVSASPNFRLTVYFLLLVSVSCCPVWAFEYFINQDGSAHLYSSFLMLELIKGNPAISEIYTFNSISVPNSSGHWLMVFLLNILSPLIVTKIMVTLTFAGFVAAIGWLRLQTVGREGLKTSLLIGAVLGFNWLWFVGFYNFIIGVICFTFTIGLFYRWREKINLLRTMILSLLFLIAYFSHIVSFVILAGSIIIMLLTVPKSKLIKSLILILPAFLPILPLAIIYKSISVSGGGFFPVWRNLDNGFSIISWFSQIRTADPFIIISRKSLPFITQNSEFYAVFTPLLWIFAAFFLLTIATLRCTEKSQILSKTNLIFLFLMISCVFAAMFAPDDFGLNNGSVLRERLFLCGLIFFVPLFRAENSIRLKRFAQFCLIFVLIFQITAVWDYSFQTNRDAKEFLSVQNQLAPNDSLASVVLVEDDQRFHSIPLPMLNNNLGFAENRIVWDNYEIGHYLFPIVAKNLADKQFVFALTRFNAFSQNNPKERFEEKLGELDSCLAENHTKIKTLVVWGKDSRIETVIGKWFETKPFFENGRVRLFHHK